MKVRTTLIRSAAAAAVVAVGLIVPAADTGAAPYPGGGSPPEVLPNRTSLRATQTSPSATLPITGTDAVGLAAIAGVAVGAGVVLARRNRRALTR